MSTNLVVPVKLLILSVIISALWATPTSCMVFDEVSSMQIWITVSSLATKERAAAAATAHSPPTPSGRTSGAGLVFRQIELNWINAPLDDQHDFLALYLDTPPDELDLAAPVHVHRLAGRMSGKTTTEFYLPLINFMNETRHLSGRRREEEEEAFQAPSDIVHEYETTNSDDKWNQYTSVGHQRRSTRVNGPAQASAAGNLLIDECLGYCLAYFSQGRILARNCLKTNPNWMHDTRTSARSLPALMLPGTHNSATYARHLDKSVLHLINKYQINQDESVFNQLVYGIRYLDLRVGYSSVKGRREQLWIYHDIFRTDVTLEEVLEQVRRFLELTSHEIIVMDFHRFTVGFQSENVATQRERHAQLLELLFNQLGNYIIPSYLGQHAPLNEYIQMGKRLLVGYANRGQLLGPLASSGVVGEQSTSLFGLYAAAPTNNRERPIKGELESDQTIDTNLTDDDDQLEAAKQQDRRVATRIYNRLKSVKLIARTFSKRQTSADAELEVEETSTMNVKNLLANKYTMKKQRLLNSKPSSSPNEDALAALPTRLGLLFPPVRHLWPNKDTVEGLAQYMNDTTCRKYFGELRSMMVELTPTVFGAISDKYDGNRRLADLVNRPVTDWIRSRWLHCMNIVASDFFQGNDLVRLAIYANRMRAPQHETKNSLDLGSYGATCRSFRPIEHLLDANKITIGVATAAAAAARSSYDMSSVQSVSSAVQPADGTSDIFSFFKKLFNL